MTPDQREALIDALVENWRDNFMGSIDSIIDDILVNGRIGYTDYTDDELISTVEELGIQS